MRVVSVVGARPQFIKAAPLGRALRARHEEILVHTGQHYDDNMSAVFFRELALAEPDRSLGIGSGSQGAQTGQMLAAIEEVLVETAPRLVLVFGDTNSTLAGALAAAKLGIPVAHVEAGLRSFNRAMPEEINRVLTDHVSTLLFAPAADAAALLAKEGIERGVHVVGDLMLDALEMFRGRAIERGAARALGVEPPYIVATIHRAENTNDEARLRELLAGLDGCGLTVVLPLHPRTKKRMAELDLRVPSARLHLVEPQGYLDMLSLQAGAACVATDSGGMQKEAYFLGVPCVTLRDETEWTATLSTGWNVLAGADATRIAAAVQAQLRPHGPRPALYGDGRAAQKIVDVIDAWAA